MSCVPNAVRSTALTLPWGLRARPVSLAACTQRLDANFDGDPLGAPLTSPGADTAERHLRLADDIPTAVVVANPAGGIGPGYPTQAHYSPPDDRRVFLIAAHRPLEQRGRSSAERRSACAPGWSGDLGVGVRPASRPDYLGAVEASSFLPPAGGSVHAMRPFSGEMLSGFWSLPALLSCQPIPPAMPSQSLGD